MKFYENLKQFLFNYVHLISFFCHRRPERSFETKTHQSILCVRCSGVHLGFFLTFIFLLGTGMFFHSTMKIKYLIFFVIPIMLDAVTQKFDFRKSNNYLRLVTGFLIGIAFSVFFSISARESFFPNNEVNFVLPNIGVTIFSIICLSILIYFLKKPNSIIINIIDYIVISSVSLVLLSFILISFKFLYTLFLIY